MNRRNAVMILTAATLAAAAMPTLAGNRVWDAGAGTLTWDDKNNWSGGGGGILPAGGDNAQFDDTGFTTYSPATGYTIAVNSPQTINLLRFGTGDGTANLTKNLTITGSTLSITVGAGANAIAATAFNSGSHVIQSNIVLQPLQSVTGSSVAQFGINGTGTIRIDGTVGAQTAGTQLNKSGTGVLVLNGNSTFTGATSISAGTLELNGISSSALIVVQGLPTINPVLAGGGTISGDLVVSDGAKLSPGGGIKTFTVQGTSTLGGTVAVELDGTGDGSADLLDTGALIIDSTAKLDLAVLPNLDDEAYIFARYDSLQGEFLSSNVTGLPGDRYIDYHYNGNQIAVVPEPAVLAMAGWPMLLLRRRRRSDARRIQRHHSGDSPYEYRSLP